MLLFFHPSSNSGNLATFRSKFRTRFTGFFLHQQPNVAQQAGQQSSKSNFKPSTGIEYHSTMVLTAPTFTPRKLVTSGLVIFLHLAMLDYLLHLEHLQTREPEAPSIKMRIVADLLKNSEKPIPLPLSLTEPVTDTAAPDVEIAPPSDIYKAPSIQMIDNLTPHSDDVIIATTGPRPIPDAPNTFPMAAYPASAKAAGQEGIVTLSLQVSEQGDINDVLIEKSSGYATLDQAAARYTQRHWKFQPGTRNGVPVGDWKRVLVTFGLQQIDIRY